jgi:hypothetical protein
MKRIGRWTGWFVLLMIFCALCACAQNVSLPKAVINVVTAFPNGRDSIPETCQSQADLLRAEAQPDHVIAHELPHIFLDTQDEERVERLARQWLHTCDRREDSMCRTSAQRGVPDL